MSGKTNTLMDAQLAALDGLEVALYTTAPTRTTAGTEAADSDYVRFLLSLGAAADGTASNSREADNDTEMTFGVAGAASGYTIQGLGVLDGSDNVVRFKGGLNIVVPVGHIPRIPISELTFVEA